MLPSLAQAGNRLAQAIGPAAAIRRTGTPRRPPVRPPGSSLSRLAQPDAALPRFVAEDAVARKYLDLLGPLDWDHFPERPDNRPWPGPSPAPRAPYVAAELVKLNEGLRSMGHLRRYLVEHPALVWLLGFPLSADPASPYGFDVERSLPSRRQLGRVLRELDHAAAQFLLTATVQLIGHALPPDVDFGDVVAGDTKHILAWVKENNPKQYVEERYDKTKQPKGDPDCKLGCKKRRNKGEPTATRAAHCRSADQPRRVVRHPHHRSTPASHATSASSTGATPPASSPPRSRAGANLCSPNSPRPSTRATLPTSSPSCSRSSSG